MAKIAGNKHYSNIKNGVFQDYTKRLSKFTYHNCIGIQQYVLAPIIIVVDVAIKSQGNSKISVNQVSLVVSVNPSAVILFKK